MAEKPTYNELLRRIRKLEKAEYEGKQAEDKLQNRETIIQSIFDVTPVGICIMKDRVYQRANRFWCESFGYREKDIIGHTTAFLYETPEEYERVGNELYGDLVKNGIGFSRTRLKCSNGEIRDVDLIAKPLNPEDLESGTLVVVHDITERKRAQDALQESESRLRTIFDVSQAGIILATPQGVIAYANQGMAKMLVCTQQALIGSLYSDHLHPDQRIMGDRLMHQLIAGDIDSVACEQHYMRSDGKDFFGFLSGRRHENKQGKLISVVGIIADITEQKNLENQLRRASKMESIGTLAGGIAHNFNNILMGIQGRASLMMVGKDPSHPDVEHLKGIEEYVQSAAELTKDLLGFAKGGKYEVKLVDLNALIKNENEMFGCTKKEIQLYGKYEKDLWAVEADSGQIKQVLLNLYVNAWQAMPGGGELYVQTENVTIGEEYLKPFEIAPGKYVKISVTDTGTGIDDTIQEKIFDPFFSTRGSGVASQSASENGLFISTKAKEPGWAWHRSTASLKITAALLTFTVKRKRVPPLPSIFLPPIKSLCNKARTWGTKTFSTARERFSL